MSSQRHISIVLLSGITLLLAACMGLSIRHGGPEEDVTKWPPTKKEPPHSLSIAITCRPDTDLGNSTIDSNSSDPCPENYKQIVFDVYAQSGLFSSVSYGRKNADLHANVIIESQTGEFNTARKSWLIAPALTLFLIPFWGQETLIAHTTFSKSDNQIIGTLEKKESFTFVVQWHLDLFIAIPGCALFQHCPDIIPEEVLSDITKATVLEAQKQHIL